MYPWFLRRCHTIPTTHPGHFNCRCVGTAEPKLRDRIAECMGPECEGCVQQFRMRQVAVSMVYVDASYKHGLEVIRTIRPWVWMVTDSNVGYFVPIHPGDWVCGWVCVLRDNVLAIVPPPSRVCHSDNICTTHHLVGWGPVVRPKHYCCRLCYH